MKNLPKSDSDAVKKIKRKSKKSALKLLGQKTLVIGFNQVLCWLTNKELDSENIEPSCQIPGKIEGDREITNVYLRPFLLPFLREVSKDYEIIVYSSMDINIIKKVCMSVLRQETKYISAVLGKDYCLQVNAQEGSQMILKDNNIFMGNNRCPSNTIFVDHSIITLASNPQNAVPIPKFEEAAHKNYSADGFLFYLKNYLGHLSQADDVRDEIAYDFYNSE
jgi:TFIIF-interacting CTD phosphatase-like protein